ncbi:hypothetical protein [Paenibacillus solani]|uniref:hypothetical protein n=1 Tax=Paenibacillus solani TaxID=1705565 RepID=UPI003D2E7D8F
MISNEMYTVKDDIDTEKESLPAGLLPQIASDFDVTQALAGQLGYVINENRSSGIRCKSFNYNRQTAQSMERIDGAVSEYMRNAQMRILVPSMRFLCAIGEDIAISVV